MGFQAINGKSYISFPKNSRSHNMMLFVAEIRKCNLSNKDIIPYIDCVINDYSVNRENIIEKFNIQSMGKFCSQIKLRNLVKPKDIRKLS